ncbi:MAG: hypothetical protein Kow0092_38300 [Deferrisomatales bacterium]
MIRRLLPLLVGAGAAVGAGCAPAPPRQLAPATTVWSGQVRVEQDVVLPRGSRLVVEPGTVVRFAFRDDDGDGWGDASLRVEGELWARGTPDAPVVFTSSEAPARPGGWGEIRIDFGRFELAHAVIEGSTRGLHAHFSEGAVRDSVFRRNVDGTRLGRSVVAVERCLFYGHPGKALNARRCRNRVRGNLFHHNRNGVFLFEADGGSTFEGNRFRANDHPLRLGDFFEGTVSTRGNDWGGPPPAGRIDPEGEGAFVEASPAPVARAGPTAWPTWQPGWTTRMEGYVDAAPVVADDGVFVASWGGTVARLRARDGAVEASVRLPDAVDASPAVGAHRVAVQAWDRGIYLLDRETLEVLDLFREEPSPADDHRQAAPILVGDRLVAGTWAGRLRGFRVADRRLVPEWTVRAAGPFRAALRVQGEAVLAPCADGTLYAVDARKGTVAWRFDAGAPLLSAPAVWGGTLYLGDRAGRLHALDLATGRTLWSAPLGGPAWYAPAAAGGGRIFQGDDGGRLTALDPRNGAVLWSRPLGAGIRARPAWIPSPDALSAPGAVAVPTLDGRLYLLDPRTGLERDCWLLGEGSQSSPARQGARIFLGDRSGAVHALDVRWERP